VQQGGGEAVLLTPNPWVVVLPRITKLAWRLWSKSQKAGILWYWCSYPRWKLDEMLDWNNGERKR